MDKLSPERLSIDLSVDNDDENIQRHIARYEIAKRYICRYDVVLDFACGTGYGTEILATRRPMALIGHDISAKAIEEAKRRNLPPFVGFKTADLATFEYLYHVNVVVCFETIEHVPKEVAVQFMKRSAEQFMSGDTFIGSSPMLRYKDGEPYITNPYHINEMPREELLKTIQECFPAKDFDVEYFHQKQNKFIKLADEDTGFLIFVARAK